ncbi:MAG: DNA repair protein RecO [Syntrophobacteraceae bacterium]|jgi:DNA repair protein RecO (recombination protein O)|nr:DNA repair protein RecO [Syntrophobacteraceae bacterium]
MSGRETEAFILKTEDLGEADRWVSLYARSGGRLRGLAKGARRSRRRFANVFEPCSLVTMELREKRSLVWIEACKLLDPHLALREHVGKWACGALLCELVLELVPEGETDEGLFRLLKHSVWQLAEERAPLNVVLVFLCRLMDMSGYLQAISGCDRCGRGLRDARSWRWDPARGILLCSDHGPLSAGMLSIDLGSLLVIEGIRRMPLDSIWRLQFSSSQRLEILRSLLGWVSFHTGKGFASRKVIEQLDWT